jgi:hypothetical protein
MVRDVWVREAAVGRSIYLDEGKDYTKLNGTDQGSVAWPSGLRRWI